MTFHEALLGELKRTDPQAAAGLVSDLLRSPDGMSGSFGRRSVGQQFVESREMKHFASGGWRRGSAGFEVETADLQAGINAILAQKATITSAAVGSATPGILSFQRVPGVYGPPTRRMRVRDLINFYPCSSTGVDFVREDVFTNNASPVAETVSKEESALTFVIDSANVRTIAHWVPAARQVLEDLSQLQAYVDTRLLSGLADVEDFELLRGSGSGSHIKGIITGATTVYSGVYDISGDTYIDKINHAIAELEDNNFQPDGIVLNPSDWRRMQVQKTEEGGSNKGAYLLGGPAASPIKQIWDMPVALTPAMLVGKFLVGSFSTGVMGFDRTKATVETSSSHEDFFVRNLLAIRAEQRTALAILTPAAFRYVSFT